MEDAREKLRRVRVRMSALRSPAAVGLAAAVALIAAAIAVPAALAWQVHAGSFAPLHSIWAPRFGIGTLPSVAIAVLALLYAFRLAARLRWRWLLVVVFVAALAWMVSLALVDGPAGLGSILDIKSEYLGSARAVTDLSTTLQGYIGRIPLQSENHWPVHLAGHPAGALLFFYVLVQLGLGSWQAAGAIVIVIAATTPLAVLITLRRLADDQLARAAAPFLVFGPAAVWMAVSADAVFTAVAAWGLCLLAVAATARARSTQLLVGLAAGALLGYCVMLSYGLPLLAVLALAIVALARTAWPVVTAVLAAVAVVLAFALAGFAWWEAYPVLVERYWDGIASRRPASYWTWGNLGALAISAGPVVGSAIALGISRVRGLGRASTAVRTAVVLTLAAAFSVLLADLSQMSKAEVERIWLPFVPWLLVSTALLPERWRRPALAVQLGLALLVQTLLFTRW
jgi:hypothetical protein